ncbi:MAG: hypothetical protein JSR58_05730 [Verrucomicrobia bacterium]|nr:hypothetical protein [Verrucomicrobiota bacterium]
MRKILALSLAAAALSAHDYGFLEYYFVDCEHPIHIAGRYRQIGKAEFEKHSRGDLKYADGYATAFYTHFLDEDNALSFGAGYNYLKMDWDKNPRFREDVFNYAVASVGLISTTLERWRWIVNGGLSVDANHFDFGKSAVYHAMLWGRYHYGESTGVHIGALGYYGVKNGYALPIIGFDWRWGAHWKLAAIFPVNFSVAYGFNDYWSLEAAYSGFGGPYRYPRRAHDGRKGFHDPIFSIYSSGLDLNLRYDYDHLFRFAIGGGWNFGGWIHIKNSDNRHGKYYNFNSAPYAQATIAFTF